MNKYKNYENIECGYSDVDHSYYFKRIGFEPSDESIRRIVTFSMIYEPQTVEAMQELFAKAIDRGITDFCNLKNITWTPLGIVTMYSTNPFKYVEFIELLKEHNALRMNNKGEYVDSLVLWETFFEETGEPSNCEYLLSDIMDLKTGKVLSDVEGAVQDVDAIA